MASRLYLRQLDTPPGTILDHLVLCFPHVPRSAWQDRIARGLVLVSGGTAITEDSPYRAGLTVFYEREVSNESPALEEEVIIYRNSEIIVADKPHGMPVTPAGQYVERCLLIRLQKSTGVGTIAPMHRLDMDTAGLVLFTLNEGTRGRYHQLFAERRIEREYLAVAQVADAPLQRQWRVENRMEAGTPWYRRRIVGGPVNAITEIELLEQRGGLGLFRLRPDTGKKHQLRVHMASIGFPIAGDSLYPTIREKPDCDTPLQLLARRLSFLDPMSGEPLSFTSLRQLWG